MKATEALARMQRDKREAKASRDKRLAQREWLAEKIRQNEHYLQMEARRRLMREVLAMRGKSIVAKCSEFRVNGRLVGSGKGIVSMWFDEADSIPAPAPEHQPNTNEGRTQNEEDPRL